MARIPNNGAARPVSAEDLGARLKRIFDDKLDPNARPERRPAAPRPRRVTPTNGS